MSENLLKSLTSYVTPDLISKASSLLGESSTGISNGMSAAIPSLLGGLLNNADKTDVMDGVMGLVNQKDFDADNVMSNLSSLLGDQASKSVMGSGNSLMQMLFGNKQSGLIDMIAGSTGIKSSSALKLMGMAAPMVLGYIKKSGFNVTSLTKALFSQKDDITSMLPKGMNSLMGFGDKVASEVSKAADSVKDAVPGKPKNKWLWPVIILAGIIVLFLITRNCDGDSAEPASTQVIYGTATQAELDASFELGANPDAETVAKFQERAGKTFSAYRGYCYDEKGWLNPSWDSDITASAAAAADHKAKTGHSTGVRWQ